VASAATCGGLFVYHGRKGSNKMKKFMSLSKQDKERIEEEERVRAEARAKYSKPEKRKTKPFTWLALLLLIFGIIYIASKNPSVPNSQNTSLPTPLTKEEQAAFNKTKAGQICLKHPTWTKDDCTGVADKKIWVGMKYEMLVEEIGKPDHSNLSNYGSGSRYQYCWDNKNPNCFYDDNNDGIIDAYN